MPSKRTGYAPWSLTREAGVLSATVDGTIDVPQSVQPTINAGFVDEKGNWQGEKSSDENFFAFTKHVAIPNGETVLAPATATVDSLDMTGFSDIQIAIRPSNGGNFAITAVMGPDTNTYANLRPVNAATTLRGAGDLGDYSGATSNLFNDTAESLTVDVWNIFIIKRLLNNQKMMQFKIVNNSGADSDIEVAFLRLV